MVVTQRYTKSAIPQAVWNQYDPELFEVVSNKVVRESNGVIIQVTLQSHLTGQTFTSEYACF